MEKLMDTDPYNRAMPKKLIGDDMFGDTYPTCSTTCQKQTDCDDCPIQEAFARLGQYERTGLTPEQVMELKERDTAKEPVQFGYEDERKCNCRDAIIVRAFKKLAKCMNDGWISVEERLPEDGSRVLTVIKHHKWIADYDSLWVPDCEKTQHPEYTEVCEAISSEEGWTYRCHEMDYEVDEAYIKPKRDIANPISEVIAWRPLPEPYRPERI